MKLAVISDTHLGDPECTLVQKDSAGNIVDGKNMSALLDTLGKDNDYLIFLGDVMDFAIDIYEDAYKVGSYFFGRLKKARVAKRFVYIPGNHDYNIWDTIEYQANVINRIEKGKPARKFRMSVPFIIDDRTKTKAADQIKLAGVKKQSSGEPYGGMFLDYLIPNNKPSKPGYVPFIVAFPNIYLFTDKETVFLTHGHYLGAFWSVSSWIYKTIKAAPDSMSMKDFVSINFPLCQLGSTGVGQAGLLSDTAREIEKDVTGGNLGPVKVYLSRLLSGVLDFPKNFLKGFLIKFIIVPILTSKLKKARYSDYISDLIVRKDSDTVRRFNEYLESSIEELKLLNDSKEISIAPSIPDVFLFGHTHVPISSNDNKSYHYKDKDIKLLNSGGWLAVHGDMPVATGGEIFVYETGKGFLSKRILV